MMTMTIATPTMISLATPISQEHQDNLTWLEAQDPASREVVEDLMQGSYPLEDIKDFAERYGLKYVIDGSYEQFCAISENYPLEAVEAYVDEFGMEDLDSFEEHYRGQFGSRAEFAEEHIYNVHSYAMDNIPEYICIDWERTWYNMSDDFVFCSGGFVFSRG